MKLVKSLIVLAAVILLGIVVYLKVYRVEETRKAREVNKGKLVQFDLDTIRKFTLVRPDSSITLERGAGRIWNITAPIKSEASGKQLYGLFDALSQSNILYEVDDKPKDLGPYGLDRSAFFMAMEYDDGKPDTLFLGKDTPDRTMTYVKFSSGRKVLAVGKTLSEMMKKPVRFYRSRTALNVMAEDIQAFEISRGKDESDRISMVFDGVSWMMQYPWALTADTQSMDEILKKFGGSNKMTLDQEHASIADLAKYGLDKPSYVLTVQLKYGMQNRMLLVGNKLTEKGRRHLWYAKQFDNDLVFTIENSFVTLISREPVWFVEKQPVKFDRNAVDKIVLSTQKEKVTLIKNAEGKWSSISPVDKNVPENAISGLFAISRFLLINSIFTFQPTPADLAKSGINKPKFTLEFFSGDQILVSILYGKTFTMDILMTYFQTSLSPAVYLTGTQVNSNINYVLETVFGK